MRIATLLIVFALAGARLRAQDSDTVLLRNGNRKFTILSQIEDSLEVSGFVSILQAKELVSRREQAAAFIKRYRRSWMLPQAYDLSARAGIDLGKYQEALEDGRFSLRLLPENPSLMTLMANIEAQDGQIEPAIRDASDALEYLDQIERPANLDQREWNVIRPELKASAYFARARAEASRGMAERSTSLMQAALDDLNKASGWNAEDPELFYLRGVVEIQMHKKTAAASDLAFVYGGTSSLREKAKNILLVLARETSGGGATLGGFLANLPPRIIEPAHSGEPSRQTSKPSYAGPESCRPCHESQYAAWRKTGMARMLQPYKQENVLGDFSSGTQYMEGADVIRLGSSGRPYFELPSHRDFVRYYVDFTIGSKWQQAYATRLPDGRLQVLPIEYNLLKKKWINYWKLIDPPDSPRANIADFSKLSAATNYQQNCAICHTSQLKANEAGADPMQHASFLEPGVDCEMCHGPSSSHITGAKKGTLRHEDPLQPPIDFRSVDNRKGVQVCGQCHRQSAVREIGKGGEMNYSITGDFIPKTWQRPLDAFSRKAFYKDGRFRETTFIVEAFTRSACYLRGTAQCASCHSPHLGNFESNKTALKFSADPNEMCLGCHQSLRNRTLEHSRHSSGTEASKCVTCHMPRIVNALLFKARSHQIEVPTIDLTQRFGQEESPNVCLTCHAEKTSNWVREQLASWPY